MKSLQRILIKAGLQSVLAFSLAAQALAVDAIQIGSHRELFVDHFLIEKMEGVQLKLHEPHREGIAVKFDRPWEGAFSGYTTVIKEGEIYRMYYRGLPSAGRDGGEHEGACYAESKRGIAWT